MAKLIWRGKEYEVPDLERLREWGDEGASEALDGCWVESDGYCEHGYPSWLIALGMI